MFTFSTDGAANYVNDPYKPYIYTFLGDPAIKRLDMQSGRQVQVFQPKGCEVIDVGDDVTIRWNAVGTDFDPSEKVKLEYSHGSGALCEPVMTGGTPASIGPGSYPKS